MTDNYNHFTLPMKTNDIIAESVASQINYLISPERYTVEDIARFAGVSPSMVYQVRNREKELRMVNFIRLAKQLANDDELSMLMLLLPSDCIVTRCQNLSVNGRLDDEITEMVEVVGELSMNFSAGNKPALQLNLRQLDTVINRATVEVQNRIGAN